MYAEERQQAIAAQVATSRRVSVSEAAAQYGVTTETVRRDLAVLERSGLLRRVHGGAVPIQPTSFERDLGDRAQDAAEQKLAIAEAASELVPGDGGSILLDAGTTTAQILRFIPSERELMIVTNAPAIAATVAANPNWSLQLIGGRVRSRSQAAVGPQAVAAIAALRVDVAFLGTNAVSAGFGLSTPDLEEAATKAEMVRSGQRSVVVTDSRKFGEESLNRFATFSDIDVLVTDAGISAADQDMLSRHEIELVIA